MAERAVVDFQRRIRRWSSKGDNIRGTSAAKWLKRDKIIEIRWLGSSKDFVRLAQGRNPSILQREGQQTGL